MRESRGSRHPFCELEVDMVEGECCDDTDIAR